MFKRFIQLFMILICLVYTLSVSFSYIGGDGTSLNPFEITTCYELDDSIKYSLESFVLAQDVDCVNFLLNNPNSVLSTTNFNYFPNLKLNSFEILTTPEDGNVIPKHLFDIDFKIYGTIVDVVSELRVVATFENFGFEPTPVNYSLELFDFEDNSLLSVSYGLVVETNDLVNFDLTQFSNLNLTKGMYKFVFSINYNEDVNDEFFQYFRIKNPEEGSIDLSKKDNELKYVIFGIFIFIIIINIFIFIISKFKKTEVKKPEIKNPEHKLTKK